MRDFHSDYRNQLEVGVAERHDPVGGAPGWVTPALDRSKTVTVLDLPPGRFEVCHSDQYVVELHRHESTVRGSSTSRTHSGLKAPKTSTLGSGGKPRQ